MGEQDEAELLARAAKGGTEAFRALYEAHHAATFRFAYRLTNAVDVAEDLTQECFVRLIESTRFNKQLGSVRQYLYGIMRNLVRQREQGSHRDVDWNADCDPTFAADGLKASVNSQELNEVVQSAVSALPPLQREAIVLCVFEELSLSEAAAVVGTDVGTIKSRLHRGREGLRRRLAPYRSYIGMPVPKGRVL